jgi:hypothetical protein
MICPVSDMKFFAANMMIFVSDMKCSAPKMMCFVSGQKCFGTKMKCFATGAACETFHMVGINDANSRIVPRLPCLSV